MNQDFHDKDRSLDALIKEHLAMFLTPKDYFRQQYYEALDTLCVEIDRRFNQEGIKLLGQIESLLINAFSGKVNQPSGTLESLYRADIDFNVYKYSLQCYLISKGCK